MSVYPWHCIHAFINVVNQSHYIAAKHLFSLSGCQFSKIPFPVFDLHLYTCHQIVLILTRAYSLHTTCSLHENKPIKRGKI